MAGGPESTRMRAESARGGCRPEIRPEYSSCRPRVPFVEDVVVRSALASHGELSAKALPETVHLQEFGEIVDLAAARVRLEVGRFDFDVGKRGEDRGGSAQNEKLGTQHVEHQRIVVSQYRKHPRNRLDPRDAQAMVFIDLTFLSDVPADVDH